MNTLNFLNQISQTPKTFKSHPVQQLPLENQILYLMGLGLVMSADGCFHEKQQGYIRLLINSLELDSSLLDDVMGFAQSPDQDTAISFFNTFRRNPLAQLFLFDAYMLSMQDGELHEQEKAVIDKMAEQLEMLKGTQQDIFHLYCYIRNKDWIESCWFLSPLRVSHQLFAHVLIYFDVDYDELDAEISLMQHQRLQEKINRDAKHYVFRLKDIQTQLFTVTSESSKTKQKHFLALLPYLPKGILLLWLQNMLDNRKLRIEGGWAYFHTKGQREFKLEAEGLEYNPFNQCISLSRSTNEYDFSTNQTILHEFQELYPDIVDTLYKIKLKQFELVQSSMLSLNLAIRQHFK